MKTSFFIQAPQSTFRAAAFCFLIIAGAPKTNGGAKVPKQVLKDLQARRDMRFKKNSFVALAENYT